MKLWKKKQGAFTLLEMVVVIFIISILLLIIIPNIATQKSHAESKTDEAFITTIQSQVDLYDGNSSSVTLEQLEKEHYISSKQLKHANDKGITIKNGVVQKS